MEWRLGVVGSPVAHSLSPVLHEAGLARAGLRGHSVRREVSPEEARDLRGLVLREFDAVAVTAPLKGRALAACDVVSDVARRTSSVNGIVVRDGRLAGDSTDGGGFLDALAAAYGEVVADAHAVVLGAGGAARAIVDALVEGGAASVSVIARRPGPAELLAERSPRVHPGALVYRPLGVVVNTVPASVRGPEGAVLQGTTADTVAVDLAYEPRETPWLARYRVAGCRTQNGLAMLCYTAAR
ncbi:MAG TPA: hypothetical protein PLS29_10225, partial [Acidimicrobiales bacterium]|nr:hypothetical protein [Acidimicrobiales bacterium]